MSEIILRSMTELESAAYRRAQEVRYTRHQVECGGFDETTAQARAREGTRRLWPEGRLLPGHHLWMAEVGGQAVGGLWLAEQAENGITGQGWVYDIEIDAALRGQGYGRALMLAAVERARSLGCSSLGLNVFGGNESAIRLYESLGFQVRVQQMSLPL